MRAIPRSPSSQVSKIMSTMESLRQVTLILVAIGAVVALIGLAAGLYPMTGRLPFRWVMSVQARFGRMPATADDVRRNGLVLALSDLAGLLLDVLILAALLLQGTHVDRILAIAYAVVSLAGFAAVLMALLTAARISRDVRYLPREAPSSAGSRGREPAS
jgi:hypothetical protein